MTFQFKIQLQNITNPPVWRRVEVPAEITFSKFHSIIQAAMGWDNYHLYSFSPTGYGSIPWIEDEEDYYDEDEDGDEDEEVEFDEDEDDDDLFPFDDSSEDIKLATKLKLSDIFKTKGQTFTYIYDFGDDWKHKITLEEIDNKNTSKFPKLIAGKGTCPPEDCGGPMGYENIKEVLGDKNHPEYKEMKAWLYGSDEDEFADDDEAIWDPNDFDLEIEKEMFDDEF